MRETLKGFSCEIAITQFENLPISPSASEELRR